MKQTENNALFFTKTKLPSFQEKLRKIGNLYRKKRSSWHICGRDVFWRNIRQGLLPDDTWKKNFRKPKGAFDVLVAELRPYISANPLSQSSEC